MEPKDPPAVSGAPSDWEVYQLQDLHVPQCSLNLLTAYLVITD